MADPHGVGPDQASPQRTGWRPSPNLVAAAVLVIVAASLVLWQRPWDTSQDDTVPAPPADAAAVLRTQAEALTRADDRTALRAAAGPGRAARTWADEVDTARRTLGVRDVSWRYLRGGDAADRADGSTSAVFEVTWSTAPSAVIGPADGTSAEVELRLVPTSAGRFSIRSTHGHDQDRLPVWLAGDLDVTSQDGTTVITVDGGIRDVDSVAQSLRARRQVDSVVPLSARATTANLLVVAPRTRSLTAQLLGRTGADVDEIAGVTTTLDGRAGSAPVVVLNPDLFATMDARARQVVMSHEATHLLVGTSDSLPAWVAEGFADYVALHGDTAPLTVSAGQILRQVKAEGAPKALPEQADFDHSVHGLGATYESAWMIFRMLDEEVGSDRIVRFYAEVRGGTSVAAAAQRELGLSIAQITRQWRAYLTKSASTVS